MSVHALTGVLKFRTMMVTGFCQKCPLHIFTDSGSTYNFMDIDVAKRLGCRIEDITWNFDKLSMQFFVQGRRHVLRGASTRHLKTLKRQQLGKILQGGVHLSMLQLCIEENSLMHSLTTHRHNSTSDAAVSSLLLHYDDHFQEPSELPLHRPNHDHQIPLFSGSNPVNRKLYRYAKQRKDVVDGLVKEYLKSGVIQASTSPYASLVVLVGKRMALGDFLLIIEISTKSLSKISFLFLW
jgi:hypothetical protein